MREKAILRIVAKLLIPLIVLFALYVQFHGDYSPGGGFQAGIIFSAGFILYRLIFGIAAGDAVIPRAVLLFFACFGVLLFTGTGAAALLFGGEFLNYNVLAATPVGGQHLGIILVELGVGFTVGAAMLLIYDSFAAYAPPPADAGRNPDKRQGDD